MLTRIRSSAHLNSPSRNSPRRTYTQEEIRQAIRDHDRLVSTQQVSPYVPGGVVRRGPAEFQLNNGDIVTRQPNLTSLESRRAGHLSRRRRSAAAVLGSEDTPAISPVNQDAKVADTVDIFTNYDDLAGIAPDPTLATWALALGGDSDVESEERVAQRIRGQQRGRLHLEAFERGFRSTGGA